MKSKVKGERGRPATEADMTTARMAVVASSIAFGVEVEDVSSRRRCDERTTMSRQTAYWLMRKGALMPDTKIGNAMMRDHATAIHGCRRIDAEIELNLTGGYVDCIRRAAQFFKEFQSAHKKREVARKKKELEGVI